MVEDENRSLSPTQAPTLLATQPSDGAPDRSSRILATLEGRAPDPEVRHLPADTPRYSRAWILVLFLLVAGVAGALWLTRDGSSSDTGTRVATASANTDAASGAGMQTTTPASPPNPDPASSSQPTLGLPGLVAGPVSTETAEDSIPQVASIVEERPYGGLPGLDGTEPVTNPLAALTAPTTASQSPNSTWTQDKAQPGPTRRNAAQQSARKEGGNTHGPVSRNAGRNQPDTDAALLSALMAYGLPPASPPGTRVYKSNGVFMRIMPGTPLEERLRRCGQLGFLESEQCRLSVCAGQWGLDPSCPTPRTQVEP